MPSGWHDPQSPGARVVNAFWDHTGYAWLMTYGNNKWGEKNQIGGVFLLLQLLLLYKLKILRWNFKRIFRREGKLHRSRKKLSSCVEEDVEKTKSAMCILLLMLLLLLQLLLLHKLRILRWNFKIIFRRVGKLNRSRKKLSSCVEEDKGAMSMLLLMLLLLLQLLLLHKLRVSSWNFKRFFRRVGKLNRSRKKLSSCVEEDKGAMSMLLLMLLLLLQLSSWNFKRFFRRVSKLNRSRKKLSSCVEEDKGAMSILLIMLLLLLQLLLLHKLSVLRWNFKRFFRRVSKLKRSRKKLSSCVEEDKGAMSILLLMLLLLLQLLLLHKLRVLRWNFKRFFRRVGKLNRSRKKLSSCVEENVEKNQRC